jgi:hypothetical protein
MQARTLSSRIRQGDTIFQLSQNLMLEVKRRGYAWATDEDLTEIKKSGGQVHGHVAIVDYDLWFNLLYELRQLQKGEPSNALCTETTREPISETTGDRP